MDVRTAEKQNLPQLLELWEERQVLLQQSDPRFASYVEDRNGLQQNLFKYLDDNAYTMLVAVHEGQPIGFIVGEVGIDNIGKILLMALDAHRYHAGVGRQLYQTLRQNLLDRGMTRIAAIVPRYHAVEQAFWRSMGGQEFIVTDEVDEEQWKIPRVFMWMTL